MQDVEEEVKTLKSLLHDHLGTVRNTTKNVLLCKIPLHTFVYELRLLTDLEI